MTEPVNNYPDKEFNVKTKPVRRKAFIVYYAVILLLIITAFLSLAGFVILRYQEKNLLLAHIEFYPELINLVVDKQYESIPPVKGESLESITAERLQFTIIEILGLKGVKEAALINLKGEILSRSDVNLPLKNISDNPQYIKAKTGETGYEYTINDGLFSLGLYIPVKSDDIVTGIVYILEGEGHLSSVIHDSRLTVWGAISFCGLLLYLVIIYLFCNSHKKRPVIDEPVPLSDELLEDVKPD
ncbi:MAG: hypothetical protein CVV49_01320 [Spirochaetae bacterium HGW-Spirochaetae-5]|nr:MAG: hypothetical protein CVV49_01320 [Spirochaetae bacterium HGW-Spirochaetae-5]